ncbi:hypothetical protein SAPIO_CDS0724 [Scedosporium apiospermum]|uniref:Uncharacterized protein n=1 Tax=Pseudallescheria apiosperma TaxID=563466 RepID=A0A084GGE3_PSEDA|nr:uncharacterized protein SAPIO_CDS0724 [Scedosporium apiospermum]KEZ46405.1 hypothetical protein SAPIO_CDS0724 [Scedosporium apiospermum]
MPARGTIRCLTALASIITLVPFSFAAIDCNAESHTISSQQDASDLDECAESGQKIRGEVVISPETATDIEIASFGNINGRIVATDNPYLESLKLGNATTATSETSPSLSLINVTSLGSLVFDDSVWRLGDLDLRSLPKLATLDWGVGRPPIDPYIAQNLELLEVGSVTLTGLPNLRKIGSSGQEIVLGLNVTMKDVALESVDAFTNFTESRHLAIEGIPNVNRITFSYVLSESVTIQGNGELDIAFTHPDYRGWRFRGGKGKLRFREPFPIKHNHAHSRNLYDGAKSKFANRWDGRLLAFSYRKRCLAVGGLLKSEGLVAEAGEYTPPYTRELGE